MATTRKIYTGFDYETQQPYQNAIRRGYFDSYEENPQQWKHTFIGAYIFKHPNRVKFADIMRELNGGTSPTWDDLTDIFFMDFKERLVGNYTPNTCRTIFAEIKALLNRYKDSFDIPSKQFVQILSMRKEPSQAVYLTQQEIYAIHCYAPRNPVEREVKRVFMIECLTGARHIDAKAMRIQNLDAHTSSLIYVPQKTKTEVTLPIHKWLRRYLVGADTDPFQGEITDAVVNSTLRLICQRVHINAPTSLYRRGGNEEGPKYQFVTTHTGRRSFATNLFVAGCDPYTIARFMGHANPNTTIENYIIGFRPVPEAALRFFSEPQMN